VSRLLANGIRYLMRRGWDRGVLEGDRVWVVIGGAALLAHLAGRAMRREPYVVFSERLEPGESFRITNEARD
jgi:hypothetical protein